MKGQIPMAAKKKLAAKSKHATRDPLAKKHRRPSPSGADDDSAPSRGTESSPDHPQKLSALNAAALVLAESADPLNCQEMIRVMAEKGLWSSPGGKTPASTLYSSLLREIRTKGAESRFQKATRGKFTRT
jgi:hypothetical protein